MKTASEKKPGSFVWVGLFGVVAALPGQGEPLIQSLEAESADLSNVNPTEDTSGRCGPAVTPLVTTVVTSGYKRVIQLTTKELTRNNLSALGVKTPN